MRAFTIFPKRTTSRYFGKCLSYDLEVEKDKLVRISAAERARDIALNRESRPC